MDGSPSGKSNPASLKSVQYLPARPGTTRAVPRWGVKAATISLMYIIIGSLVKTVELIGDKDNHRATCPFSLGERNGDTRRVVVALNHVKRQIERHKESLRVGCRAVLVDPVTRVPAVAHQEHD